MSMDKIKDMLAGQEEKRLKIGDLKTALRLQWIELAYSQNESDTMAIEASLNAVVATC